MRTDKWGSKMNRDDYEKLVNPYSFELKKIYGDTFGHRMHLEEILGARSPFQSALEKAASGLGTISGVDSFIQTELDRVTRSTIKSLSGEGIFAGLTSHAEEMTKIQEQMFPERSALSAAAGLSDAITKSLSGIRNVGLDNDVLASITGSTSTLMRELNRDLHLGIGKSNFSVTPNIDKLLDDQMAATRDMISGFAKPSSMSLAALAWLRAEPWQIFSSRSAILFRWSGIPYLRTR